MEIDFYEIGRKIIGPTAWLLRDVDHLMYRVLSSDNKNLLHDTAKSHGMTTTLFITIRGKHKDEITVHEIIEYIGAHSCLIN